MTREQMILDNMGLVHMVVKRFLGRGCDREDLVQIGLLGLVNAVDRYDENLGNSFSTYAVPMIMGEIQRFLRDNSMVHISRKIKTDARKIANVREHIEKTENRKAKIDELMVLCDLTKDEIIMAIEAMQPLKTEEELQNHVSRESDKIDTMIDEMTVIVGYNSLITIINVNDCKVENEFYDEDIEYIQSFVKIDNKILCGGKEGKLIVINKDSNRFKILKTTHKNVIDALLILKENMLISGSWDESIKIWSINELYLN